MVGLHVERHKLGYYSGFALLVKKCYFYDFLQEFLQEIFSPNTHTFYFLISFVLMFVFASFVLFS